MIQNPATPPERFSFYYFLVDAHVCRRDRCASEQVQRDLSRTRVELCQGLLWWDVTMAQCQLCENGIQCCGNSFWHPVSLEIQRSAKGWRGMSGREIAWRGMLCRGAGCLQDTPLPKRSNCRHTSPQGERQMEERSTEFSSGQMIISPSMTSMAWSLPVIGDLYFLS